MKRWSVAVVAALTCLCTPHQPAWASPNHGAAQTTPVKRKPPAAHTAAQRGKPSPTKPAKPHGRRPPGAAESSAATASHRAELKDLHGRIESLQRDLSRTQASQSSVSDELRDTETAISSTNRRLRELAERQDALSNDVQQLEVQTTRLGSQIATQQKQLQALLYRRFLHGENDALQLLLSGEDPARIAQDQYFLARLSEAKARLLAQLRDSRAEKQRLADVRRDKVAELESVEKDQQKNHAALLQKQKERQAVWVRIGDQIKSQRKEIETLRANEQRLTGLIETLAKAEQERQRQVRAARQSRPTTPPTTTPMVAQNTPRSGSANVDRPASSERPALRNEAAPEADLPTGSFAALRGRLRLPVKGEIAGRFGTPRADTGATWKGLFIRSSEGNEVRAVAAGRVVFADWLRGFGNLLIIDHGDGYLSIYGNNQSVFRSTGQSVKSGDTIATVGSSGGQGESGLYFELRLQGQAFDPLKWASLR